MTVFSFVGLLDWQQGHLQCPAFKLERLDDLSRRGVLGWVAFSSSSCNSAVDSCALKDKKQVSHTRAGWSRFWCGRGKSRLAHSAQKTSPQFLFKIKLSFTSKRMLINEYVPAMMSSFDHPVKRRSTFHASRCEMIRYPARWVSNGSLEHRRTLPFVLSALVFDLTLPAGRNGIAFYKNWFEGHDTLSISLVSTVTHAADVVSFDESLFAVSWQNAATSIPVERLSYKNIRVHSIVLFKGVQAQKLTYGTCAWCIGWFRSVIVTNLVAKCSAGLAQILTQCF